MSKRTPRKSYTKEFKRRAVQMSLEPGPSVADVADQLGVTPQYLSQWRTKFKQESAAKCDEESLDAVAENLKLKAEIKQLKMDNEILKKAASYFASQK